MLQAELLSQQLAVSWAMFLFCVQHTYEEVYRVPKAEYNRTAAGLCGASYLPIPWWWRWATVGVEYHHLHHLNARVPCYKLQVCHLLSPTACITAAVWHQQSG
jgi:omega-6 fatty acid desaturase (delta-12 desaturase)